ncbi:MAG TPA: hypothetical protein VI540_03690 [Gaiellaceae bacterium]|nr:hypothetical protein [Gaiellaceae bacterium]
MTDIRIRVDSDDADRDLARLALFLTDLRSFWPKVVPLFVGWMRQQFETEGSFGSGGWAPLAFSTVDRKARLGLRPQILQATGAMKQAASRPSRRATAKSLTLQIDDPKLQHHQSGTASMPARPLIFERLPLQAEHELGEAAEDYVRDLLRRLT